MPAPKDPIKREEWRRKQSELHKGHRPVCGGFEKGHTPWNKGIPMDEVTRLKVSKAKMGHISWNKGKTTPPEVIEKLRQSHIGQVAWNKGLTWSQEARNKISKTLTGRKRGPFTEEHRKNMSLSRIGMKLSIEHRKHISQATSGSNHPLYGKEMPVSTRLKISKALTGNPKNIGTHLYWSKFTKEERIKKLQNFINSPRRIISSSIENIIDECLSFLGIRHERQYKYRGFIIDFYLPDRNQFIECNGEYWHRLPERIRRDKIVAIRCKQDGIKLTTLWENEINRNAKEAVNKALRIAA